MTLRGALALGLLACVMLTSPVDARTARESIVALDIGHVPDDPGAKSVSGRDEYHFNRDLALDVAEKLRAQGVIVVITEGDLLSRPRQAAEQHAQLFVSVHHDSVPEYRLPEVSVPGNRYRGFSVFVSRKSARVAASRVCASRIGAAMRGIGRPPSLYHADHARGAMKPFADRANGVHYYDNLIVLKRAVMPAVLFEAGVIVNAEDERVVSERKGEIAQALASGILSCLK